MTNRLPSFFRLEAMSSNDAWGILQQRADALRAERQDILDGHIFPWGRATKRGILESNRRKLKRVYAAANDLGCHVGQPDAPNP